MPWFDVDFGVNKAGLSTVGYREYNTAGGDAVARTTVNVVEIGDGAYGVDLVALDVETVGLQWDTGETNPIFANEEIAIRKQLELIEGTFGHKDIMRLLLSSAALKLSGATTTTLSFRNLADDKDRIVATVDGNGNRTAIILDVT